MERAGHHAAARRGPALQRAQAHDRRDLPADADADAAGTRARRPCHADRLPDDSTPGRL